MAERGMNQIEFANFLGVSTPTISRYLHAKMNPSLEVALDIASKCNVSLDWLAGNAPLERRN